MLTTLRRGTTRFFFRLGVCLLTGLVLASAATADLPSSVASRVKKINTQLEAADQALEADRLQTAQRKLKDTERPLKEIVDRYTGKFDETDAVYRAMLEHLAATTARVRAAEKEAEEGEAAGAAAKAANEALCRQWIDQLGPFVDHQSDSYLRIGADLNRVSPEDQEQCRAAYRRARVLFAEYQKVEFPLEKTTHLRNVEHSLESAMKYYAGLESSSIQEAACREWVDRLAPYCDVGLNSRRYLVVGATADAQQIAERTELFEEAKAVFAIYRKAEFPQGKTFRLQTLESELAAMLEEFPKALAQSQAMISGDVGQKLDQLLRHLEREEGWKSDESKKPPVMMERTLQPLREGVERYASTVDANDTQLAELRRKLKAIEDRNAECRRIRAQRTFQLGDGYTGADLAALKKRAKSGATEAYPGAKLHTITVPSGDWAIEEVVEFTDTSRTALRHRVTRSVRAQVSLETAGGEVWLQEVYLGQDQQPDGGWGALKGHTTWADPMVRENLGKLDPAKK